MFKKIILGLCFLFCSIFNLAFADSAPISNDEIKEIENFFNLYVNSANSYDDNLINYYFEDAQIKRVVIKPNGDREDVIIPMDRYKKELNKGKMAAKLAKYKNKYLNKRYEKIGEATYRIKALRYPRNDKIGLNAEFQIVKTPLGYKISKEEMETTVQRFLNEK